MSRASFTMSCGLRAYSRLVVDDLMAIHRVGSGGSASTRVTVEKGPSEMMSWR